jgi:hypothetical protein
VTASRSRQGSSLDHRVGGSRSDNLLASHPSSSPDALVALVWDKLRSSASPGFEVVPQCCQGVELEFARRMRIVPPVPSRVTVFVACGEMRVQSFEFRKSFMADVALESMSIPCRLGRLEGDFGQFWR